MALTHKFDRTDFDNNLRRATKATAVMIVDLSTYLKNEGVLVVADMPPRFRDAYQILLPIVEDIN